MDFEAEKRARIFGMRFYVNYSTALKQTIYIDGEKKRILEYGTPFGFKLRFCPECGANITRRIRAWRGEKAKEDQNGTV